jgi:hypothetical protein
MEHYQMHVRIVQITQPWVLMLQAPASTAGNTGNPVPWQCCSPKLHHNRKWTVDGASHRQYHDP